MHTVCLSGSRGSVPLPPAGSATAARLPGPRRSGSGAGCVGGGGGAGGSAELSVAWSGCAAPAPGRTCLAPERGRAPALRGDWGARAAVSKHQRGFAQPGGVKHPVPPSPSAPGEPARGTGARQTRQQLQHRAHRLRGLCRASEGPNADFVWLPLSPGQPQHLFYKSITLALLFQSRPVSPDGRNNPRKGTERGGSWSPVQLVSLGQRGTVPWGLSLGTGFLPVPQEHSKGSEGSRVL